jgi:hypothetical protein
MADDQKKKDAFDELGFDNTAFEALQRDFQEVIVITIFPVDLLRC